MKRFHQSANALLACYSFRGHDFDVRRTPAGRTHAKRVTRRARRRLDRALSAVEAA